MAGVGIGLGLGGVSVGAPPLLVESQALIARMTAVPSVERQRRIDTLIRALKVGGLWSRIACLYVLAGHDAQAARLNWKGSGNTLTPVNDPVFTVDRGYTGDGATSYLDSGYDPTIQSGFDRDDAHAGVWTGNGGSANQYLGFNLRNRINPLAIDGVKFNANSQNLQYVALPVASATGWTCWSRASATAVEVARGADTLGTIADTSNVPQSLPFYLLAHASTGPVAAGHSSRRLQAAHWGLSLSASERGALNAALAGYMTAVGA